MRWLIRPLRLVLLLLLPLSLSLSLSCGSAFGQAEPPAERQLMVMLQLPKAHYRPDGSYIGNYGEGIGARGRQQVAQQLAERHGLALYKEWAMPLAGVDCFVMRLPEGDARTPAQVAEAVSADARVAWAQPVNQFGALGGTQQEPLYAAQPAAAQWQLSELHRHATGRGVRVAVVDSGVEATHPDLAGQVALNLDFVGDGPPPAESHGTAVAGVIVARADNGLGIAGIAPQARLLALRGCWQAGAQTVCNTVTLAKALNAAIVQRADIVNLSLGGPQDRLLGVLIDQARARGAVVVAAQPGEGVAGRFPASHPGVLVVGAAPPGPPGGVVAPGRDVPSTAVGGGWALVSGSSFAAAHASGLLALMRELDAPGLQKGFVDAAFVTGPRGRIDPCATLARHANGRALACAAVGHTAD